LAPAAARVKTPRYTSGSTRETLLTMVLPSPPAAGLKLLAGAFRARTTGVLTVGSEEAPLRVQLEEGQIVGLGPAAAAAVAAPEPSPMPKPNDSVRLRLERVLAEIGMRPPLPSPEPLLPDPAASGSLRDRLIDGLVHESHPAHFEEGADARVDTVAVVVATEPLILEAVRQLQDNDAVRTALGDLDQRLVATAALAEERTLTLTEGYLLSRIDGVVSAREVLQLVPLDPDEVERTLLGLLLTGRIESRPAAVSPPAAPRPQSEPPEEQEPGEATAAPHLELPAPEWGLPDAPAEAFPDVEAEPFVEAEPIEDDDVPAAPAERPALDPATIERRREILDLFQSLPLKNHFEVLGVEPGCSDADVRQAYVALAKRFHPDARRDRRLEDMHDILEAIFIRVGEAWEVLGETKSRASYEQRSGIVRRARPAPPPAPAPASRPATDPGIPRTTASSPPPAPPPPVTPGEPGPGDYVPAEEILFRARLMLTQARYWEAIQLLETTLPAMEPRRQQHRGRLLLARAYSKNPNWLRRAEETLQGIMKEDPTNAEACYELGLVYKSSGFTARAQAMFRRALELRPGHKEAEAELGIQPEVSGGGGLLKRLFGKGKAS
jgi:tetratricopeptide (TPR) repeat protein